LSLFVLGSLTAALSSDFQSLLFARFLQAIGAAAGVVASRAIVTDTCDTQSAARVYSMLTQMMMIAPITAPTLGSLVLIYGDWSSIFWILCTFSVLCLFFTLRLLPETLPVEKRVPLSVHNIASSYALQLCKPRFLFYTIASGFTFGCLFIYVTSSPFVFISMFNLTPRQFGYIFAVNAAGMILTGQINLFLLKFYSVARLLFSGIFIFVGAGLLLLALVYFDWVTFWRYWLLLALALSMLGLITGNITAITMENTQEHAGVSSALMGLIQFLLAGMVGFVFSFMPLTLNTIPVAIVILGLIAIGLCAIAQHYKSCAG
jgi:DHA1 family bicyclomycin/chloramphenicol resistance-like MFS transporter